eukprot:sb/3469700/
MTQLEFASPRRRGAGDQPRLSTTRARVEETRRIRLCRFHNSQLPGNSPQSSRPRVLGDTKRSERVVPLKDKQCTQEVHYYLRSLFEDAKKSREKQQRNVTISRTAPTTPVAGSGPRSVPRVTFSAFGLPTHSRSPLSPKISPFHQQQQRRTLPSVLNYHNEPPAADQRVFIKLSRPSFIEQQRQSGGVRKQTYRPFCLVRSQQRKELPAPPSSPTRIHSVKVA